MEALKMHIKCSEFHVSVEVLASTVGTLPGVIGENHEEPFTKVWVGVKETKDDGAPQC